MTASRRRRCDDTRRAIIALLAAIAGTLWPHAATAQQAAAPADRSNRLQINLPVDLSVTLGGAAVYLSTELFASKLASSNCRWCDRHSDGSDSLNGFDSSARRALRWSDTKTANLLSGVFSFGLAPLAGTGLGAIIANHDGRLRDLPTDILVAAEAAVIASNTAQLAKLSFARERPNVHALSAEARGARHASGDNESFFSGHATLAFSLATSAGTIASLQGYKLAPLMWVSGLALATAGGYLRVAADRHYLSDVLAGAGVGSAIGFAVPYFAHRRSRLQVSALNAAGARGACVTGVW